MPDLNFQYIPSKNAIYDKAYTKRQLHKILFSGARDTEIIKRVLHLKQ